MRKMDKKIDKQLIRVLTDVCDTALKEVDGFQWLTHVVDYTNFPKSLQVICVFDTGEQLATFMGTGSEKLLIALIQSKLNSMGVKVKKVAEHISYDTEEHCTLEHGGNWANRLARVC